MDTGSKGVGSASKGVGSASKGVGSASIGVGSASIGVRELDFDDRGVSIAFSLMVIGGLKAAPTGALL